MRLAFILLAWLVALALPGAAAAAAVTPRVELGSAFSSIADIKAPTDPVVSDGERYVAYVPAPGIVRVRDTKWRRTRDVKTPCLPEAAGAARVLLSCGQLGRARPAILDPRTLAIHVLGPRRDLRYFAIGRFWLAAEPSLHVCMECGVSETYINWHTGQRRTVGSSFDRNLDSSRLLPEPAPPRGFDLYVREGRTLIYRRVAFDAPLEARDVKGSVRLSPCRPDCDVIDPSAGKVTWLTANDVYHGYDLATHRRYRWPIRIAPSLENVFGDLIDPVVHTRYEVLVSTLRTDYGNDDLARYTVMATAWHPRP